MGAWVLINDRWYYVSNIPECAAMISAQPTMTRWWQATMTRWWQAMSARESVVKTEPVFD